MSAALIRRALVASVAVIGAGAARVAAATLTSPAPDPDAALLDLIARHAEAEASETRRVEILTAWDAHFAERRAVENLTGHTAATAAEDAAADLLHSVEVEIKRGRPVTLAGLRALARWIGERERAGAAHDDLRSLLAAAVASFGEVVR